MKAPIPLLLALAGCTQAPLTDNGAESASMPTATASSSTSPSPVTATPTPEPQPTSAAEQPFNTQQLESTPAARGMPPAVQRFIADYEQCEHWAGEEPYDADRRREIEDGVKVSCTGIDARLSKLRKLHADDPAVAAKLADYSPVHM